jgi:hypothetical protein
MVSELLSYSENSEGDLSLLGEELKQEFGEMLNNHTYLNSLTGSI